MGTRSALTWPFGINTWPNQPIGTGATYIDGKIPARVNTSTGASKPQEIPMGTDQTQPSVQIFQNAGQTGNRCLSTGSFSPAITIPYNQLLVIPSAGDNYPPAFIGASGDGPGNLRYEGGNFAHCTNGGLITAGHFGNHGTMVDNAVGGGSGGSGLSTFAGTIRFGEFTNGTDGVTTATVSGYTFKTIRHCLRIDLRVSDLGQGLDGKGYSWPANKADGGYNQPANNNYYSGVVPSLVNGTLLAIPQTVDLNSLGLTTKPGKQLAWTFQNFGARCANTQHNSTWAIATEWSVSAGGATQRVAQANLGDTNSEFFNLFGFPMFTPSTTAFGKDMNIIIQKLSVVSNDSATNIGGGGTPITALAPSFGATLNPPFVQQVNGQTAVASSTLVVANAKTATGAGLGLMVGARAPATVTTPAQVGASWTNTAQVGVGNATVVLAPHSVTAGHYITVAVSNRVSTTTGSIASVSDGVNSYARISGAQVFTATNDMVLEVWGAHATTTASITITATFAAAGAGGAVASEWTGLSEVPDITVVSAAGTGTPIGPLSSGPTASTGDLVIAAYANTSTPTIGTPVFTPSGTTVNVPDLSVTATGANNHLVGISEIISGASGNAQSVQATTTTGRWIALLVCLAPVASSGSAPTLSISGGGTWTQAYSVNSPTGLGTSAAYYLSPTGTVPANGITITSSSSTGSIEYEFYEMANATYQAQVTATGTSTAPTVQVTPTAVSDVQIGNIFWPNQSTTIVATSVVTWENDATTVGLAPNANSSIQSGGNVAATISAQTYAGTLSGSVPWVAGILNFTQIGGPAQVAQPGIGAGDAQVSVNWVTPNNNGSNLLSYTAKLYSGVNPDGTGGSLASTITGIAAINYAITPYVIGSLSNGTAYSVSITAINGVGSSAESQRSLGVTPAHPTTVPGQPVAPTVLPLDTMAQVTITPPSSGGQPIQGYTFNCYQGVTLIATQTQLLDVFTFSGLTDGVTYGFTGIAFNGNGNSVESPATLAVPIGAPSTPLAPVCVPGNAQVTVTVSPPANNGSGIQQYIFNCYTNPAGVVLFTQTQASPVFTFTNLSNGTPYYFTTIATNAVGQSPESSATQATPLGPAPPTPQPGVGRQVQVGTTYQYVYRGKTTKMLYKFSPSQVPTALLDQFGNLLEYGTYNGETLVLCAQDGEVRLSSKGSPGPDDPYGFGIAVSPWESNV